LINSGKSSSNPYNQQQLAQQVLTQFQEHPDAWSRVPDILGHCSFHQYKARQPIIAFIDSNILSLSFSIWHFRYLLEKVINTRWKTLPEGQRQGGFVLSIRYHAHVSDLTWISGIRNFVVGITVKIASDETNLRRDRIYLRGNVNKLNLSLVQVRCIFQLTRMRFEQRLSLWILKQEWPHNWPTFIPELVESSKTNEKITWLSSNFFRRRFLSKYSAEQMTQAKVNNLKNQM
jgi:exportin-1